MTDKEALKLALEALENQRIFTLRPDHEGKELTPKQVTDAIAAIKEALAQTEFIKHEVENADDWSEWVCPDPKKYLMKCCDCGLVHEAQFGVVRYKSETERDDCDIVNDPNLQAVFRMRRSEEWTPEDTAHRVGGLPMAEPKQDGKCKHCTDGCPACDARELPEQEPVAYAVYHRMGGSKTLHWPEDHSENGDANEYKLVPLSPAQPAQEPLTNEVIRELWLNSKTGANATLSVARKFARAIEAAHDIKENT